MESEGDSGCRKLDVALDSSIDLVALNNKVVAMRGTVIKCVIFTVRKIKKRIKKLRDKKGTNEQVSQNKRKIARLQEELQVIRHLAPDQISKYALGCTMTVSDVCKQTDVAIETRALTRLAWNSSLQASVKRFREEHDDWKSLAAFLLYKQSGRRIKKKKKKPDSIHKMITNVKAGELLVKTYLQEKLDKNISVGGSMDSCKTEGKNKKEKLLSKCDSNVQKSANESKSSKVEEKVVANTSFKSLTREDEIKQWSDDDEEEDDLDEKIEAAEEIDEEDNTECSINNKQSFKVSPRKKENPPVHISSGEMVVKKLNLEEMSDDETETADLFHHSKSTPSSKSKRREKAGDSFFISGDVDEGDDDSNNSYSDKDDDTDDNDDDNSDDADGNSSMESEDETESSLSSGKKAFHSTFVHSLSDSKRSAGHHGKGRQSDKGRGKIKGGNYSGQDRGSGKGARGRGSFKSDRNRGGFRKTGKFDGEKLKDGKFNKNSSWKTNKLGQDPKWTKNFTPRTAQSKGSSQQTEEKLHPSWQASKKRKEQGQIQVFQGKKIKFDDD